MKLMITIVFLSLLVTLHMSATTHTITTSGFNFVPDNITVNLGDTISFSIGASHNAVEVSLSTWNANGTTSNGGFQLPLAGGIIIPSEARTYYYVCVPHASLGMKGIITVTSVSGVESEPTLFNGDFALSQNYPNPFNPNTSISFMLSTSEIVSLKIYNATGQEIANLVEEFLPAGHYRFMWNADNLASGSYISALTAGGVTQVRKMLLVR